MIVIDIEPLIPGICMLFKVAIDPPNPVISPVKSVTRCLAELLGGEYTGLNGSDGVAGGAAGGVRVRRVATGGMGG